VEHVTIRQKANPRLPVSCEPAAVHDVRSIANAILDRADNQGIAISNMALNKIVYFVHCDYLIEREDPLVGAKIEAWQHGPVFREIYHAFKKWGDQPIKSRALKVDTETGEANVASLDIGSNELGYLARLIDRYLRFSAAQLRAISHTKGGPWHFVWAHDGESNPGMRISNDLIKNLYSPGVLQ
jgi:uncharacterized phage-associated protein